MIIIFLGYVSEYQLRVITAFYFLLTLFCLYLIIKYERKLSFLLWTLIILIFPIIGSLIYLSKYFILKSRAQ